jgi:hypothetical protein
VGRPDKIHETLAALSKKILPSDLESIVQHGTRLPVWMMGPLNSQIHA